MTSRGEPIAPHPAVVLMLVGGLSIGGKAYDYVSSGNASIVYDITATHAASHSAIHNNGTYEVAHIGCFSPCGVDAYTQLSKALQELLCAIDDFRNHFSRDERLVAPNGGGEQYIVGGSYAEEVVEVHYEGVLGYPFPNGEVAGFTPIDVSKGRLCTSPIGMH